MVELMVGPPPPSPLLSTEQSEVCMVFCKPSTPSAFQMACVWLAASTIGAWQQCGGQSACGSHCVDGVWPGASCPSMYQCYRQSQWYW